ncbi:hypothetical protein ACLX1H_004524 [Fusarium chlamydosporum]
MTPPNSLRSFLLSLLFFFHALAAPGADIPRLKRRDGEGVSTLSENSTALEPVVPPEVDPKDLSIFALDTHVMLAWAGTPSSEPGTRRMRKRDDAIFSQANFTFKYPVIPLDHSTFVSTITCSKGALSGVISNSAAYNYAKTQWKGNKKIIFITSTDGCGEDHANDLFLAQSVDFSDSTKTFTAKGASTEYVDVFEKFTLNWGPIGTLNVRRALDKRAMFEPHALDKRASKTVTFKWDRYLHYPELLGTDEDAPWENAAKLIEWGSEGGEADDSYAKGEVADPNGHHKRGGNYSLVERDLSYGLALYCVECGFGGSASLTGAISGYPTGLDEAYIGLKAQFKAGLNLGLKAFVKYEKEWSKDLVDFPLASFGILGIADVNPYIGVSIEAGLEISATGTLLIGASVEWDNIDIMVDLLDGDKSHSNGLSPVFKPRSEARGELKLEASLGLPVSVGVKVSVFFWDIKGGVRDTPSVVLEGSFEANAGLDDNGDVSASTEGDCYGIAWNIHFENALDAFYQWDDDEPSKFPLIEPLKSDPIAEGCIGFVNDGTGQGGSANDVTGMSGNGLGSGGSGIFASRPGSKPVPVFDPASAKKTKATSKGKNSKQKATSQSNGYKNTGKKTTSKKPHPLKNKQSKPTTTTTKAKATTEKTSSTCTPSAIANTKIPPRITCNKTVARAKTRSKSVISTTTQVKTVGACAETCLKNKQCMSFGYNKDKECQLYSKALNSLA